MKIIYIGNKLEKHNLNPTTIDNLSPKLSKIFKVISVSSFKNKVLRFFHMVLASLFYNYEIMLIDTYSSNAKWFAIFCSKIAKFRMKQYIPYLHGGNIPSIVENKHFEFIKYLKESKNIVVQTDYLNSSMIKNGITNTIKIPNFIDLENYPFINRDCVDEVSILWVRAYQKIYNPKLMVELCILLLKHGYKPKICMIGPEKDNSKSEILQLIKEKNIEKYFIIKSRLSRNEWVNYSLGYNFFINTSNVDNTPVSVVEAMALGMIVISSNVGGLPKLIDDNVNGFLVEPNNANKIFDLINIIINKDKINISFNARKKAETFDWKSISKLWVNLLNA